MLKESKSKQLPPRFEDHFTKKGFLWIAGIDEAGRGPLAGPVVASSVILKTKKFRYPIRDGKTITPRQREEAFHEIHQKAYVGVGIMSESVIDEHNILRATFLAMSNAVDQLVARLPLSATRQEDFQKSMILLVDGNRFQSRLPFAYQTIVDGDAKVLSIACASIVAKVIRDRILNIYDRVFPQYGFKTHKGYPTRAHKEALKVHGPSLIHRRSFNAHLV